MSDGRDRFLSQLRAAVRENTLVKLTLGRCRGSDPSLRNLFVRPVVLKAGPRLAFVWRHRTRDLTGNHPPEEALALLEPLIGGDFLDAHLFVPGQTVQLECDPGGRCRYHSTASPPGAPAAAPKPALPTPRPHDRSKVHPIPADASWLQALGVTRAEGRPREGMAAKFRQIQKFAELLGHLIAEAGLASEPGGALKVADMGCGKGYLTFAVSFLLGEKSRVDGIEVRTELVDLCNRISLEHGFASRLRFSAGTIEDTPLDQVDVLIALHACDTATDDALAKGISAGAKLLVVAPCCHKELRPQLVSPPVLAGALRHGIFQDRQAEFVTDALRAQLLEWAGYRTKVFEFVSTEHTAKNLMIAAIKTGPGQDEAAAARLRDFARFYGIRTQALSRQLGFQFR